MFHYLLTGQTRITAYGCGSYSTIGYDSKIFPIEAEDDASAKKKALVLCGQYRLEDGAELYKLTASGKKKIATLETVGRRWS